VLIDLVTADFVQHVRFACAEACVYDSCPSAMHKNNIPLLQGRGDCDRVSAVEGRLLQGQHQYGQVCSYSPLMVVGFTADVASVEVLPPSTVWPILVSPVHQPLQSHAIPGMFAVTIDGFRV